MAITLLLTNLCAFKMTSVDKSSCEHSPNNSALTNVDGSESKGCTTAYKESASTNILGRMHSRTSGSSSHELAVQREPPRNVSWEPVCPVGQMPQMRRPAAALSPPGMDSGIPVTSPASSDRDGSHRSTAPEPGRDEQGPCR